MTLEIPGYTLKREIGSGGMAAVYLAIQDSLDRRVALKVMSPALAADQTFTKRFLREAKTVAALSHPNIVAIYDVGVTDKHLHYFSMEFLSNGDFSDRIRRGTSQDELIRVISSIAQALGFAHQQGYVHRDVKPGNILFNASDTPVLSDFGIARAGTNSTRMTGTGVSVGTSHYMSPEQARGKEVDGRSDLYSLGVVAFEVLAGHTPYDGEDGFAIAYSHVFDPIPKLPPEVAEWQPFIEIALAKRPDDRFQDAAEMIRALKEVRAGGSLPSAGEDRDPIHATTPIPAVRAHSPTWKQRVAIMGATLRGVPGTRRYAVFRELIKGREYFMEGWEKACRRLFSFLPEDRQSLAGVVSVFLLIAIVAMVLGLGGDDDLEVPALVDTPPAGTEQAPDAEVDPAIAAAAAGDSGDAGEPAPSAHSDVAAMVDAEAMADGPPESALADAGVPDDGATDGRSLAEGPDGMTPPELGDPAPAGDALAGDTVAGDTLASDDFEDPPGDAAPVEELVAADLDEPSIAADVGEGAAVEELDDAEAAPIVDSPSVTELLALAAADLEEDRLTTPADQNAFDRFRQVLELDPGNADALAGLGSIVDRYFILSRAAVQRGDHASSARLLERAGLVGEAAGLEGEVADARDSLVAQLLGLASEAGEGEAFDDALDALRAARRLAPGDASIAARMEEMEQRTRPAERFRDTLAGGGQGPEMIAVSLGPFELLSGGEAMAIGDDRRLAISASEITVEQFRRFVLATRHYERNRMAPCRERESPWRASRRRGWNAPGFAQSDDHPVVCVTWEDATAMANWLSSETGLVYRLPTEAEWEFLRSQVQIREPACDADNLGDIWLKAVESDRDALECEDGWTYTAPVSAFPLDALGFAGLLGNVREWTADCWNEPRTEGSRSYAPALGGDCGRRVVKGGSWYHAGLFDDPAAREGFGDDDAYNTVGFRLVRAID